MGSAPHTGQHSSSPHSTFPLLLPRPASFTRLRPAGPSPRSLLGCVAWGAPTGVTAFSVPTVGASSRGEKCHLDRGWEGLINAESSPGLRRGDAAALRYQHLLLLSVDAPSTANLVSSAFYLVEVGFGRKKRWNIAFAHCGGAPKFCGRLKVSTPVILNSSC